MKSSEDRRIEERLRKLEGNSHPPVNWQELIHANIERIDSLESENSKLIDIIMTLTDEKKKLKDRVDIMEEILYSYLPIIEDKGE